MYLHGMKSNPRGCTAHRHAGILSSESRLLAVDQATYPRVDPVMLGRPLDENHPFP